MTWHNADLLLIEHVRTKLCEIWIFEIHRYFICDQTVPGMVQSVRLSVRPSIRPSHLFDNVPFIASSWIFFNRLPLSKVMPMQEVKVRGQSSSSGHTCKKIANLTRFQGSECQLQFRSSDGYGIMQNLVHRRGVPFLSKPYVQFQGHTGQKKCKICFNFSVHH